MTNRRKVGMTSNHHALYVLGYTRATMAGTEGCEGVIWSESQKAGLSSDCRLKPACMKLESLVIASQHIAVNTFPGLAHTARHTTKVGNTRSRWANPALSAAQRGSLRPEDGRQKRKNLFRQLSSDIRYPHKHAVLSAGGQPSKVGSMIGVKS